jgi:hypothetical protein
LYSLNNECVFELVDCPAQILCVGVWMFQKHARFEALRW